MNTWLDDVEAYLGLRRRLGFKLVYDGRLLADFAALLEREGATHIATDLAVRWATQPSGASPAHWARRLSIVRGFARHRSAFDPRTEVPPQGLLPFRYRRKPPHLYSDADIERLIEAANRLPSPTGLRARTYSTVFALLAVTGMRVGEVIGLDRDDVDLRHETLEVRWTKFGKSRLVPVASCTVHALRRYARSRDRLHARPATSAFFLSETGTRLTKWSMRGTFVRLSCALGWRKPSDSHGPRVHDLRHSFAVRTLVELYRRGLDVEQHMAHLATYLGHAHVSDTYWYLSATPELLGLALERMEDETGREDRS
jgi:integrase/recombinase XerD